MRYIICLIAANIACCFLELHTTSPVYYARFLKADEKAAHHGLARRYIDIRRILLVARLHRANLHLLPVLSLQEISSSASVSAENALRFWHRAAVRYRIIVFCIDVIEGYDYMALADNDSFASINGDFAI